MDRKANYLQILFSDCEIYPLRTEDSIPGCRYFPTPASGAYAAPPGSRKTEKIY